MQKRWMRRFWFVPPVVLALAVLLMAPKLKYPPQQTAVGERAVMVRVVKAPAVPVLARAVGYGSTRPANSWDAVAEVSGQVVWLADDLKNGSIVPAGTDLLRIDDADYRLALTQADTQLNALQVKAKSLRDSLALEEKSHALLARDFERKRKLRKDGSISASLFDEAERALLKSETALQSLRNNLAVTEAERDVAEIHKATAELDLQRTRLVAPFDVRITERKIGQAQYANKGQLLFSADAIDRVEIEAQFPIGKLRPLIARPGAAADGGEDIAAVERVPGAMGLEAVVRLKTATHTVEWQAQVDRVAAVVDPQTQTIGVVVVVDDPYAKARPGQRPPLVRNTFVEVELRRRSGRSPVVIPSSALRGGKVYLVGDDSRLAIRKVKPAFIQGEAAVVAKGLEEGARVVVSQLVPAVEGMLLDPVDDPKTLQRLVADATGEKPADKPTAKPGAGQ